MELLILGLLLMGIFCDNSKDDKRAKERKRRRAAEECKRRKYNESLGYYEHLYGQGHP